MKNEEEKPFFLPSPFCILRSAFRGLPLSLQIMAPHFRERALFRAAAGFERETGYWKRLPTECRTQNAE